MNNKFILVLDHDGIIHPNELLEEYLKEIDRRASNEYRLELIRLMDERELTIEKYNLLMMEHYFIKDQVLEEVLEKFRGRIPYDLMYTIENAYKDVVKEIRFIYDCQAFDEIILNSHYNCELERKSKALFHQKYLPFVKMCFPKFHQEKFNWNFANLYDNNNRFRTNKGLFLMKKLNCSNLDGFYAIDDSLSICEQYEKCGAQAFYKAPDESSINVLMKAAGKAFDDKRLLGGYKGKGAYVKK